VELDENGKELKDTPINKYNKKQNGFFNRIFSIFKKKENVKRERPKRSRKKNNNK
jgi:hypothetical protein